MNNFLASWKSTLSGFCTILLVVGGAAISYFARLPSAQQSPTTLKIISVLSALVGIAKIVLSIITPDADKVLAKVPGQAQPQVVAAHPVPDNPADKAVLPASSNIGGK